MVMMAAMLVFIFVLIMVMMAAMLVFVFVLIMVMVAAMLVFVFVLIMVMMAAMLVFIFFLIMVMVVLMLVMHCLYLLHQLCFQILCPLNGSKNLLTFQLCQRCCNNGRFLVVLPDQLYRLFYLFFGCNVCTA